MLISMFVQPPLGCSTYHLLREARMVHTDAPRARARSPFQLLSPRGFRRRVLAGSARRAANTDSPDTLRHWCDRERCDRQMVQRVTGDSSTGSGGTAGTSSATGAGGTGSGSTGTGGSSAGASSSGGASGRESTGSSASCSTGSTGTMPHPRCQPTAPVHGRLGIRDDQPERLVALGSVRPCSRAFSDRRAARTVKARFRSPLPPDNKVQLVGGDVGKWTDIKLEVKMKIVSGRSTAAVGVRFTR